MKISGKFLKVLIPYKIYKLIANGFIVVPKYYKEILTETERYFDLSLEDHIYKDLMLMRKFGHIIDKGLHRTDASPGHSKNYYDALKQLVKKIKKTEYVNRTYRIPKELAERLSQVAQEEDISVNELVVQSCEFALDNLNKEDR